MSKKGETVTCPGCGKEGIKNLKAHQRFCPVLVTETKVDTSLKPGSHIVDDKGVKRGKVPWTLRKCEAVFGIVEYTPDETLPVTWNGISIQCLRGVSQLMPACHRDILLERKRRMQTTRRIVVSTGEIERGAMGPLPLET